MLQKYGQGGFCTIHRGWADRTPQTGQEAFTLHAHHPTAFQMLWPSQQQCSMLCSPSRMLCQPSYAFRCVCYCVKFPPAFLCQAFTCYPAPAKKPLLLFLTLYPNRATLRSTSTKCVRMPAMSAGLQLQGRVLHQLLPLLPQRMAQIALK